MILEQRIIELTFTPLAELPPQLKRLGLQCRLDEDEHTLRIDNGYMGVALMESDPITKAVQLSFAIVGPRWAEIMPNLLKRVDQEWKRRRKKSTS